MLTLDEYLKYEDNIQSILDGGVNIKTDEPFDQAELNKTLDISFEEFFTYQETQARCHASGNISFEVAMIIYHALGGETYRQHENGGWAHDVTLARKTVITQLMSELMAKR